MFEIQLLKIRWPAVLRETTSQQACPWYNGRGKICKYKNDGLKITNDRQKYSAQAHLIA